MLVCVLNCFRNLAVAAESCRQSFAQDMMASLLQVGPTTDARLLHDVMGQVVPAATMSQLAASSQARSSAPTATRQPEARQQFQGFQQQQAEASQLQQPASHGATAVGQDDNNDIDSDTEHQVSTCVVCMHPLSAGRTVLSIRCGHLIHRQCMLRSLQQRQACPTCRAPATEQDLVNAYL